MSHSHLRITQDYYDEMCIENADVFGLTEEEAVKETEDQLKQSSSSSCDSTALGHISRTFPTSPQGLQERENIQSFVKALEQSKDNTNEAQESLTRVQQCVQADPTLYLSVLEAQNGYESLLQSCCFMGGREATMMGVQTLRKCLEYAVRYHARKRDLLVSFHKALQAEFLMQTIQAVHTLTADIDCEKWDINALEDYLVIIWHALKHNENNKRNLMCMRIQVGDDKSLEAPKLLVALVQQLASIDQTNSTMDDLVVRLGRALCRLVTCLCTFEPNLMIVETKTPTNAPPVVASAHANVMAFHQEAFVLKLYQLMQRGPFDPAMVLALRSMAVHDEVVQSMVAVGLLKEARQILLRLATEQQQQQEGSGNVQNESQKDTTDTLVAIVGLFRNVCANDDVKTTLCVGDESIVDALVRTMNSYPKSALLQEHACGTIGAMALRKPQNAQVLINEYQVQVCIVQAMREHPQRATLQRQAALALRNLVSRSPELQPTLRQAGVEQALLSFAAQHASCQDEVYAALRDLGVEGVGMVHMRRDEATGELVTTKGPEMFGDAATTTNFRAVYD